jgi:phosphate transport system permease protein
VFVVGATGSAVLAVAALGLVTYGVISRGAPALSFTFLTKDPVGLAGGGIAPMIVGTVLIVAAAAAIAVPVAVLIALYLTEFAGPASRSARALRMTLDLLQGLPTIVVGLLVFGLIVSHNGDSGIAGSVALSIVMLPLIARSAQEQLLLVPLSLREGADALGVPRWRAVVGVIVPAARSGIVTGAILAVARAAGETAPLLICDSIFTPTTTFNIFGQGVPNIPILILESSDVGVPGAFARAWGAAFVLLGMILVANVGARLLLARSHTRLA